MKKPPTVAPERLVEGGGETPDEVAIGALLSRVPRVAADDLAVERVWRNVKDPGARARSSRRLRPSRPLLWAAPALAAFAMVTLFFVFRRPPSQAVELQVVAGGVFSSRLAEAWEAGKQGQALSQSDRLRTDATGRALVRIDQVASLLVDPTSDLDLEQLSTGTVLSLSQGALTARVAKRKPGEPFVVRADPYTVKVVGTLFRVERSPGNPTAHVRVSVREGVVEVSDGRSVYRVAAGEAWTSDATNTRGADNTPDETRDMLERSLAGRPVGELALAAAPPSGQAAESRAAMALADNSPAPAPAPAPAPEHATAIPTAIPTSTPTPTSTSTSTSTSTPTPTSTPVPTPRPTDVSVASRAPTEPPPPPIRPTSPALQPPASPSAPTTHDALVAPSETADLPPPAPPPPVAAIPPPSPPAAPSPSSTAAAAPPPAPPKDDPFAKALSLDAQGDVQGEARELSRAADVDPERADLALYKLGRLAQRRLNDPARALAAFSTYRERFPQGVLLPEVDFAILELDIQTGHKDAALEEGARFLARHPGSERVDEVHLLRGNLLRDRGKYASAIGDYAAVPSGARGDDALYSIAYCQRAMGDRAAAAATLRDYVAKYPSGAHRGDAQRALATENEIPKKD